jgi:hypothetical protein
MRRPVPLLLALCCFATVRAQEDKPAFRVLFNFDFRNTFVNGDGVRFYGFRLGAQRGNDVLAVGFYGLGDPYVQKDQAIPGAGLRELQTDFDYAALSFERLIVNNAHWQVGFPVSVGLGTYRRSYLSNERKLVPLSVNEIVPLEISAHADRALFWWAFVGAGAGYRHVLAADREATIALSDWTYYLKVGIRLGAIAKRAVKGKSQDHGDQ